MLLIINPRHIRPAGDAAEPQMFELTVRRRRLVDTVQHNHIISVPYDETIVLLLIILMNNKCYHVVNASFFSPQIP